MRVGRAQRRLLKWHRYVAKTGTRSTRKYHGGIHDGHSKAYTDAMFAHTWAPKGARAPWYPKWAIRWSAGR